MFSGHTPRILSKMGKERKTMSDPESLPSRLLSGHRLSDQGRRRQSGYSDDGSRHGPGSGDVESSLLDPPSKTQRPAAKVTWRSVLWAVLVLLVTGLVVQKQVSLRASLQTCSKSSELLRQQLQELHQRAAVRGGSDMVEAKDRGAAFAAWGNEDMATKMGEKILQLEAELKEVRQRLASSEGQLAMHTLAKGKLGAPSHTSQAAPAHTSQAASPHTSHPAPKTAAPAKQPAAKGAPKPAQHAPSH